MSDCGIYVIVNHTNGKQYVGSSAQFGARWRSHLKALRAGRGNTYFQRAFDKYGEAAFEFCIVEFVDDPARLLQREQVWIDALKPAYNLTNRASGGNWTLEARAKVSAALKGRNKSPEHVEKVRQTWIGRHHSEETKAKIRATMTGRKLSTSHIANMSAALRGIPKSDEHKRKVAATWVGRKHSAESRARIGAAQVGRKASIETRRRMSLAHIALHVARRTEGTNGRQ